MMREQPITEVPPAYLAHYLNSLITELLYDEKITLEQAKHYSGMLAGDDEMIKLAEIAIEQLLKTIK